MLRASGVVQETHLLCAEHAGRRIGWLFTSQSILSGAYGFTLERPGPTVALYRRAIPILGSLMATAVLVGVVASALATYFTWLDFETDHRGAHWGVRTPITILGLIPDFILPMMFALGLAHPYLMQQWVSGRGYPADP